jgi:succinate-acetate transporter protein
LLAFGAGQYETHLATDALIKTSGWLGLVAALAIYLACAEVCEFTYGRAIIPLGPLARA